MGTGLFVKDPEEIVPLVLARAGYEKRRMESVAAGVPWAGGMSLFYAFVDFYIPSYIPVSCTVRFYNLFY